ncbi:MAG: hypothetical protein ABEJ08_04050 [Halobacteriaceae archaeon]
MRRRTATDVGRRFAAGGIALAGSLALVPPAVAHDGAVHAGTPHWILLGVALAGAAVLGGALRARQRVSDVRWVAGGAALGGALLVVGLVGLTEIQVEPLGTGATPIPRIWFPVIAYAVGGLVLLASVNLGIWRWPHRPEYTALGVVLGLWIVYPYLFPAREYTHPVGYVLVLAVPVLVGYVLWRDVGPAVAATGRAPRLVGAGAGLFFLAFLLFSTGQFTLNPEAITTHPTERFVVVTEFASPLVLWPAVEFFVPSIPFFGALSVGTVITFGLLTTLVGLNATLVAAVRRSGASVESSPGLLGGVATTGATACCCCAPALYGVVSAVLGVSASPLYWTFLDPASPLGTIFFVAATVFVTASAVQLARGLGDAGACAVPRTSPT